MSNEDRKTHVLLSHKAVCELKITAAELSRDKDRMLTYEEAILTMIAERRK